MEIVCAHCGKKSEKPNGAIERARKISAPMFCNRTCFGLARRKYKTKAQKINEKRLYDQKYRANNLARIKARKHAYFKKKYDPKKAAIERKKKMPRHVEYCRRPEYRAKKHEYDVKRYHNKTFGPLANVSLLLRDLTENINERISDYETRSQNQAVRNPQVRAAQEGKRSQRDRDRPSKG